MKKLFSIMILTFLLTACSLFINPVSMPENMPDDFDFSIKFGFDKKNEINTYDGTVTKDLIMDGTATATITFIHEEKQNIYDRMKEINITETKKLTPKLTDRTCFQEPHEDDEWKITINGETYKHSISGEYCHPTDDAKELIELRNEIFRMVEGKKAYQDLPEARGGYD